MADGEQCRMVNKEGRRGSLVWEHKEEMTGMTLAQRMMFFCQRPSGEFKKRKKHPHTVQ